MIKSKSKPYFEYLEAGTTFYTFILPLIQQIEYLRVNNKMSFDVFNE